MEFNDVRAFVRVVDKGSVSAAARELHITQSAVTKRLQRLESSLGAALFDRAQRPVALTMTGQSVLERCRRLLNEMNDLRVAASKGQSGLAEVRVGVAHALGELTLTDPVGKVREEFPRLALKLTTGWSRELVEQVRSGVLDAAIVLLPQDDRLPPEVLGTPLGKERLVILGSRHVKRGSIRRLQDLSSVQWILNPEGCGARAILRRTLAREDLGLVVAVESYTYELQLLLTSEGRGLTLVPERVFRSSRLRPRLQMLNVTGLRFPFRIWSVHRVSAELGPMLSRLNQLLIAELSRYSIPNR